MLMMTLMVGLAGPVLVLELQQMHLWQHSERHQPAANQDIPQYTPEHELHELPHFHQVLWAGARFGRLDTCPLRESHVEVAQV